MTWSNAVAGIGAMVVLLGAGCGSSTVTLSCQPACPTGMHCAESGCVADSAGGGDLTVAASGDMAATCDPPCSGATPYCGAARACLPCLEDAHCPLGQVCLRTGEGDTAALCVPGCNDDTRCPAAQGKCCDHQCVDPMSDRSNCGGCGNACQVAHAAALCSGGACQPGACEAGFGDCNGDAGDGCEVPVAIDASNCGQCGAQCHFANATAGCASGCYIASCHFGFGDCDGDPANGCEGNTLDDGKNCGECGNVCNGVPHAKVGCVNATCELTSCAVGYSDCDGQPINGCETLTLTDAKNCGSCGNVCPMGLVCRNSACTCPQCNFPNAASRCVNNVCVMGQCVDGFADCDQATKNGCEVDVTTDAANCSACGMACAMGQTCNDGVCEDIRPDVMLCGNSARQPTEFTPMGMKFNLRNGCNPDDKVQALFITRQWNNGIGAKALQDYVNGGGIVLTEYSISYLVWNAAFGTNAANGGRFGGCDDTIPIAAQFNPDDQFWKDNVFMANNGNSGCGYAVQNFPGITAICGWDKNNAAVGYQNLGSGRVWATDFDWQDGQNSPYATTDALMGYMMTHRR